MVLGDHPKLEVRLGACTLMHFSWIALRPATRIRANVIGQAKSLDCVVNIKRRASGRRQVRDPLGIAARFLAIPQPP